MELLHVSLSQKASRAKQQGSETVSTSSKALQDVAPVNEFLNAAAAETVPLFEHLDFEFLLEYDVFGPRSPGANTSSQTTGSLLRLSALLLRERLRHSSSHTRTPTQPCPVLLRTRQTAIQRTIDRFLADLERVVDDVFDRLVEQAAARGLLDSTSSWDGRNPV